MFGSERRQAEREIKRLEADRLAVPSLPDPRDLNIAAADIPMLSRAAATARFSSLIADHLIARPDARVSVDREAIADNLIDARKSGRPTPPLLFRSSSAQEDVQLRREFMHGSPAAEALHAERLRALGRNAL